MKPKASFLFWLFVFLALLAIPAKAEDAPTPTVPAAPTTFHLELDQADLQAISQALVELPKRVADPLIAKLNAQLQPQVEKAKK